MSRAACFGMLLFVCPFLSPSWAQNKTEPTDTGPRRPQTLRFNGTIPALEGRQRLLIPLYGRRRKTRNQVEDQLGSNNCRRQPKSSGRVLRFRRDGNPAGERLRHKRWARHSSMSSQWHEVGLFWSTEIDPQNAPLSLSQAFQHRTCPASVCRAEVWRVA
jgi:hypothetical protein